MPNPGTAMAVRKLARIVAKPGHADQLRSALTQLQAATRKEPGCIEFTFFQAITDPDAFLLLEHFVDQAALDLHMSLDHARAFFSASGQRVSGIKAIDIPDFD